MGERLIRILNLMPGFMAYIDLDKGVIHKGVIQSDNTISLRLFSVDI